MSKNKKQFLSHNFLKNNKGISGIVVTVIMIALTLLATALIWGVINNLISEKVESSKSCFGNFGKVTLDNKFTCYDSANLKIRFSLNIGDIDVDEVLVSISDNFGTSSFRINNTEQTIPGLTYLNGMALVKLPGKNGGKTYTYESSDWDSENIPITIQIAPFINENQCETSDSVTEIDDCALLPS